MLKDLHVLPRVRDSCSYLYLEHCRIDQEDKAIAFHDADGSVSVPCASLMLLMLGPGTTITHAAVRTLADSGCLIAWTGEEGIRLYAQGLGETRSSARLLGQAECWANPDRRMAVVRAMYGLRFAESLDPNLTLQQIRGKEGVRVREAYAAASRATNVPWSGRAYDRNDWGGGTPVNRALSAGNSCLYGVCHAAVLSLGYSPALGFIHTGKMLSFVYDVADLYKIDIVVPLAFTTVADGGMNLETRVRTRLRDEFAATGLLARIVGDLAKLFPDSGESDSVGRDASTPSQLWGPEGEQPGAVNWAPPTNAGD